MAYNETIVTNTSAVDKSTDADGGVINVNVNNYSEEINGSSSAPSLININGDAFSGEVTSGSENDEITVNSDNFSGSISSNEGSDIVNINSTNFSGTVDTGSGNDRVGISGSVYSSTSTIDTGAGNDSIFLNASSLELTLLTGSGNDFLSINGNNHFGLYQTESGKDTVNIAADRFSGVVSTDSDNDIVNVLNSANNFFGDINTGSGDDNINIYTSNFRGDINGGDGFDTVTVNGSFRGRTTVNEVETLNFDTAGIRNKVNSLNELSVVEFNAAKAALSTAETSVNLLQETVTELEIQLDNLNSFGFGGFVLAGTNTVQDQYDQAVIDLALAEQTLNAAESRFNIANKSTAVRGVDSVLEMNQGTVVGSAANDNFTFLNGSHADFVNSKEGDDIITLIGSTDRIINIDGGDGIDSIRLVNGDFGGSIVADNVEKLLLIDNDGFSNAINVKNSDGIEITMSSANDNFSINADSADLKLGRGDDSVVVNSDFTGTIEGSYGNDTIITGDNFNGTIKGGEGNDRVIAGENFSGIIEGGNGVNTLLLSNGFNGNYTGFTNLGVTRDSDITLNNNASTISLEGSSGAESISLENDFRGTIKNLETLVLADDSVNSLEELPEDGIYHLNSIVGGAGFESIEFKGSVGGISIDDPDTIISLSLSNVEEIKLAESTVNYIANDASLTRIIGNDGTGEVNGEAIGFETEFNGTISEVEVIRVAAGTTNEITDLTGDLIKIIGSIDEEETVILNKDFNGTLENIDFVIIKGGGANSISADKYLQGITGTGEETIEIPSNYTGTLSGIKGTPELNNPAIDYDAVPVDPDDPDDPDDPIDFGFEVLITAADSGSATTPNDFGAADSNTNNLITATSGAVFINASTGDGNDRITTEDGVSINFETGAGADEIIFGNNSGSTLISSDSVDIVTVGDNSTGDITTNGGNDEITIGSSNSGTISAGAGDDSIAIADSASGDILAGTGIDSITLGSGATLNITTLDGGDDNITVGDSFNGTITTSTDNDTITVGDDSTVNIEASAGDNTITIGANAIINNISTASGADTITIGAGASQGSSITPAVGAVTTVDTGAGEDILNIKSDVNLDISAGANNDTINVGSNFSGHIETGEGDDIIFIDRNFLGTINNSGGEDTIIALDFIDPTQILKIGGGTYTNSVLGTIATIGDDETLTIPTTVETITEVTAGDGDETLILEDTALNFAIPSSTDVNVTDLEQLFLADNSVNTFHSNSLESLDTGDNSTTTAIIETATTATIGIGSTLDVTDNGNTLDVINGDVGNETLVLTGNTEAIVNMGRGDDTVTVDNDANGDSTAFTGDIQGGIGDDTLIIQDAGSAINFTYSQFENIGLADTGTGFIFNDLNEVNSIFGVGEDDQQESVIFNSSYEGSLSGIEIITFQGEERAYVVESDQALLQVNGSDALDDNLTLLNSFGSQDSSTLDITYSEIDDIEFINLLGEENFLRHDEDLDWIQGTGSSALTLQYEYIGVINGIEILNLPSSGSILTLWGDSLSEINGTSEVNEVITLTEGTTFGTSGNAFALNNIEQVNIIEGGFAIQNDEFLKYIVGDAPLGFEFGANEIYDYETFVPYSNEFNGISLSTSFEGTVESIGSLGLAGGTANIVDNIRNITSISGGGETDLTLLNNHEIYDTGSIFQSISNIQRIFFAQVQTVNDKDFINQDNYIADLEVELPIGFVDKTVFNDDVRYEEFIETYLYDTYIEAGNNAEQSKVLMEQIDKNDYETDQDYLDAIITAIGANLPIALDLDVDFAGDKTAFYTAIEAQLAPIADLATLDASDYVDTASYITELEDLLYLTELDFQSGDAFIARQQVDAVINDPYADDDARIDAYIEQIGLHIDGIDAVDFANTEAFHAAIVEAIVDAGYRWETVTLDPNNDFFVDLDAYQLELENQIEFFGGTLPDYRSATNFDADSFDDYEDALEETLYQREFHNYYTVNHSEDANNDLAWEAYVNAVEEEAINQGATVQDINFDGSTGIDVFIKSEYETELLYLADLTAYGTVGANVSFADYNYSDITNQEIYINHLEDKIIDAGKRMVFNHDDSAEQINGDIHDDFLMIDFDGAMSTNLINLEEGNDTLVVQADSFSQFLFIENVENIYFDVKTILNLDPVNHQDVETIFISAGSGTDIDLQTDIDIDESLTNHLTGVANVLGDGIDDYFFKDINANGIYTEGIDQLMIFQDKGIGENINKFGDYEFKGDGWLVVNFADQYDSPAFFGSDTEAFYFSSNTGGIADDYVAKVYGTAADAETMTFGENNNFQGSIWDIENLALGKNTTNIVAFRSVEDTVISSDDSINLTIHYSEAGGTINGALSGKDDSLTINAGHSADINGNFDLGGGNDTAHFQTGIITGAINLTMGDGSDSITMGETAAKTTTFNGTLIDLGDKDDVYDGTFSNNVTLGLLDAGSGNDTVTIGSNHTGDVDAGSGNDTVTIGSNHTGDVDGGAGDSDVLILDSGFNGTILNFEDVTLLSGAEATINNNGVKNVTGTSGTDETITFTASTTTEITEIEFINIQGSNDFTLTLDSNAKTLTGDLDNQNVTLLGSMENLAIDLADGTDTLKIEGTFTGTVTGVEIINLDAGVSFNANSLLNPGGATDTVIAISGGEGAAIELNGWTQDSALQYSKDFDNGGGDIASITLNVDDTPFLEQYAGGTLTFAADA
ncbi:hypothetical protein PQO03_14945 [Lentisphaera profundi]|uniref:FHA domain-containing protein n=1 Tax=Lentisphaera profundi TaxID=1658616 RepID=A0ABY7W292_9BACT|nr:hypothetical protein [Lentisphaera profundi]WDE99131.1 hypothetical protein PQO03_14945 [Lentisphaera profundi]